MYDVFLAEYNAWNDVEAAKTPYEGSVSVPAFIHFKKLPNAASPDIISVNLNAGTEYTVEFSKNLCESLGALLPDIRLYAPDGSEVAGSSFDLAVYPEEDPSIMYLAMGEESDTAYQVVFRSYTGAVVYFSVDKSTGNASMTEFDPTLNRENEAGSFNLYEYLVEQD